MTPNENSDLSAPNLIALRTQPDALKIITERLKVKQMGPADHIRTKLDLRSRAEIATWAATHAAVSRVLCVSCARLLRMLSV